jgi:hypothetical protein
MIDRRPTRKPGRTCYNDPEKHCHKFHKTTDSLAACLPLHHRAELTNPRHPCSIKQKTLAQLIAMQGFHND